jgi:glycosyltransferase involved in cell wall biosynthesis
MKTVVYYTSTYFLDISLEIINVLKHQVNLHVLIEITPSSKNANIINVESLPLGKSLVAPGELLGEKDESYLRDYFEGVKTVHFVVHNHHTGLSFSTVKVVNAARQFILAINPSLIHFEGFTLRTIGLLPLLFKIKKMVLSIHDAVLHTGETTWKSNLPRFLFLRLPVNKSYVFYSDYSMQQFIKHTKHSKGNKVLLNMYPFSYFNKMGLNMPEGHNGILFFGRISKYKGVDILLDAMPAVIKRFPGEKLIIAGKGAEEDLLNHPVLKDASYNTTILNRYIPNHELVQLIKVAKIIVCPYIDATQSGVLMTAFALHKPVIATRVGAFEETIINDYNGLLVSPSNAAELAESIIYGLTNNHYLSWEKNLQRDNTSNQWFKNSRLLMDTYEGKNIKA